MQIPKKLPQFEKLPALFIASGEYEAHFYLAQRGELKLAKTIKMPPREEAREKQAFVGKKGGMQSLSATSHHGAYVADLKKKFQKEVHAVIHDMLAEYKLEEIYLFSPKYSAKRIMDGLDKPEQKKVRMQFYQGDTKTNPLMLIQKMWETEQEAIKFKTPLTAEKKKIIQKPRIW
ncbi:MAG: hypothetical protein ACD_15C00138G0006 [uncultured bacterium]|nr:MAG: hypothetical protein ACD_15C00138G0006 [uncultured bacterium]HCU71176.1 hypothetical protein [Candidatus Moranbacteria bacterium]